MAAIDIGAAATDRDGYYYYHNNTLVEKDNPANDSGSITSCEIWVNYKAGTIDTWVGTFSASGNDLTCRDSESIGDIPVGSKQTISGLSITVVTGDYFGCHDKGSSNVKIEKDDVGGVGVWRFLGECIDPSDSETFTWASSWVFSLYGEGETAGAPVTVTPPTLALVITLYAPTVTATDNKVVTPSTLALTLTAFAPTISVSDNIKVIPGTLAFSITTYAPTVTATGNVTVTPSTLSLILTAYAPTILTPIVATPGTLALILTTYVPMVSTPRLVTPPTATLTLTTYAPTVIVPTRYEYYDTEGDFTAHIYGNSQRAQTFTPSTAHKITSVKLLLYRYGSPGTITVSIKAIDGSGHPTGDDLCSGTTDGNTLTTSSPGEWRKITLGAGADLSADTTYAIVVKALDGNGSNWLSWRYDFAGTYAGGNYEVSSDGGSNWTSYANYDFPFEEWGGLGAEVKVTPPTLSLTLTTYAPTVLIPIVVTPSTLGLTLTTYAPVIGVGLKVIPGTLALTIIAFTPSVITTENKKIIPGTLALVLTTYAPVVTATGHIIVTPSTLALILTLYAPSITVSGNILVTPSVLALVLTAYAPTLIIPGRLRMVRVITSQYRDVASITSQKRIVKAITSTKRKVRAITSGG